MEIGNIGDVDQAQSSGHPPPANANYLVKRSAEPVDLSTREVPIQLRDLAACPNKRSKQAVSSEVWQPFRGQLPDGILSDLDGTVVETIGLHAQAWSIFFLRHFGIELHASEPNHFHGSNAAIVSRKLGRELTPDEARLCTEEKERIFRELIEKEDVKPVPGAPEFFRFATRRGIPTALITNNDRVNADMLLWRVKLDRNFKVRVTASDVECPKPDPQGYSLGIERLEADPKKCIAVEDTSGGVQAAIGAQIRKVFVVGQTVPPSAFDSCHGDDQIAFGPDFWAHRFTMGIRGKDLDREKDRVPRQRRKP